MYTIKPITRKELLGLIESLNVTTNQDVEVANFISTPEHCCDYEIEIKFIAQTTLSLGTSVQSWRLAINQDVDNFSKIDEALTLMNVAHCCSGSSIFVKELES